MVQAFTREAESYREFVESSSESLGETLKLYTFQTVLRRCGEHTDCDRHRGGHLYRRAARVSGKLTIGDLIVFTTYLASLYAPINQMFQTYGMVQGAKAGLRRCLELLAIEPEVKDRPGARALGRARGEVEFD